VLLGWAAIGGLTLARPATSGGTFRSMAALALAALLGGGLALLWGPITLPMAVLTLTPLLGGGLRGSHQALREGRERATLHQVLARRISPALLRDILREPGQLGNRIGGSRARCAVLFSDLVDFTPLSAGLEPSDLFALLNRYFAAVAVAVIEEQGLLDKFIGDAVMAEFGVPRSRGDREEARAALRAALAMQQRLEALNKELVSAGGTALRQGIGVHFGEVIAGNLGSPERLEFTVVGAVVNVASRLEGLTRLFPDHPILISGAVLDLLPGELVVEPLGSHRLKGWPDPLDVFALKGIHSPPGIPQ
jgi:adenylate cyclase